MSPHGHNYAVIQMLPGQRPNQHTIGTKKRLQVERSHTAKVIKDRFTVTNTSLWSSSTPADASAFIGAPPGPSLAISGIPSYEPSPSEFPPYAAIISRTQQQPKRVTVARQKGRRRASFPFDVGRLVGLFGFAALLLLLALALGCIAGLLLVYDEARVALLAVPLEAFEVGVCQLIVGLGRMSACDHSR